MKKKEIPEMLKNLKRKMFKGALLIVPFVGLVLISACKHEEEEAKEHIHTPEKMEMESKREKIVYKCPMHPDVISDKSGDCPKCGMKLESK